MVESFENGIREGVFAEHAEIEWSQEHAKDGMYSLKWQGEGGNSRLHIKGEVGYQPFQEGGITQNRDGFVFWVYLENEQSNTLWVTFLKQGKVCCKFPFGLAFTGWRTCWCPFSDMEGEAETDMDEIVFEIEGIEGNKAFCLYLDQIISAVPIDPRHPVRDYQVPFVNRNADVSANAHWTSLYRFSQLYYKNLPKRDKKDAYLSTEQIELEQRVIEEKRVIAVQKLIIEQVELEQDMIAEQKLIAEQKVIAERLERYLMSHSAFPTNGNLLVTEDECNDLIQHGMSLMEHHVDSTYHKDAYPKAERERLMQLSDSVDIKVYSQAMLDLAYCFHNGSKEQKPRIRAAFISMLSHLLEEGWAEGSSLGTTHHMGYPMRAFYPAVFLMRDEIHEQELKRKVAGMMAWYSGCGRIFRDLEELTEESMDTLNTLLQGIVFSILMLDDWKEKDCCLRALCRWLSHSLRPAAGLEGPFKVDGSVFHHCGHYPAYAMGGLMGATPVVYALSKTSYALGEEAHSTMRKCLLTMRFYCNHVQWLIHMSSRHPKGVGEMSQISNLEPFYYMALAGNPQTQESLDTEMAAALLRLSEGSEFEGERTNELRKLGIKPEAAPQGHITLSYACAALHRRDEWLAGVRGHSRYLWGSETYEKNNLFGRYITYGNLQILGSGDPINQADSGFFQEGWDWNSWSGTTAPRISLERLRARVRVVDPTAGMEEMLLSDESFAGGVQMEHRNGVFAMKLHGHGKYDGSFRARKSWFFFENRILCLGSDIEDADEQAEVYTTLFQHYMGANREHSMWSEWTEKGMEKEFSVTCVSDENGMILADPSGNVYCIPEGQKVVLTETMQNSLSQDKAEETHAPFSKARLSHGCMPEHAEYCYLILVKAGKDAAKELAKTKDREELLQGYQVIQKDRQAHIVLDRDSKTMAYVWFEAGKRSGLDIVKGCTLIDSQADALGLLGSHWHIVDILETDTPCMILETFEGDKRILHISDPNLHLYEGVEEDQIDENGKQKEVSLYSRKWAGNESKESLICLTLFGIWKVSGEQEGLKSCCIQEDKMHTKIVVACKDGLTTSIILEK